MKTLIVAEKPNVARPIAEYLSCTRKDGYFENDQYIVSNAYGHLFTLFDAKDYGPQWEKWNVDSLPIIPGKFQYKLIDDAGVRKQFKILKDLIHRPDVSNIINACDADREGSLIWALIALQAGSTKPVRHLWTASQTPEALERAFADLRDDRSMEPLRRSGFLRLHLDWLYGINYTIATTLLYSTDHKTVLKVGRVILPTVYMVYKRDMEIKNFKPKDFYQLKACFKAKVGEYEGFLVRDNQISFENQADLSKVTQAISGKSAVVASVNTKKVNQGPPMLFSLSDLQGHMSSKFEGYNASKVLNIAQSLYEKKFTTYPRTASNHLDDTEREPARKALKAVCWLFSGVKFTFDEQSEIFNSKKVVSHPVIGPTYIVPKQSELSKDEWQVYMEIVKRFAAHFLPKAVYEQTEIMTRVDAYDFISRGNVLVEPGWKVLYGKDTEEPDEEQPKMVKVTQNEAVSLVKSNLLAKQTKPAKPHTEASLLSAMVNCGNEKSEDILPGFCVGTEATRAEVLKKIQEIGYVKSSGKSLRITPMGISLVELFPIKQMLEPRYTGQIEKALFEIQNGRFDPDVFMDKIVALVKSGVDQMKGTKGSIGKEVTVLGKCPECGRDVVENAKAFGCSGYKEGCKFAIWKDNALFKSMKKKLTPTMVKGFLSGKVVTVKGCTSKSGKEYDARLKLGRQDNGFWGFTFEK